MRNRILSVALLGVGMGLGGCVGWHSYPPVPTAVEISDPNSPPMDELMVSAISWAVREYPVDGASGLVFNLPKGVKPKVYEWAARESGASPLTVENSHLPTYHVKEIRVRWDRAQVDVLRPVSEVGLTPSGQPVYQMITVRFEGGTRRWHVVSRREWTPGDTPPEPNYYETAEASQ